MAPSDHLRVGSPKRRKGIVRPGAANLRLSLIEHHSPGNDGSQENLLTMASSQWTLSAAPISSASIYSQASYAVSPLAFSENKLDRRRFGIATTPSQEGPWSRPGHLQSPVSSIFVLDLKSAPDITNSFIGEDGKGGEQGDMEKNSAPESPKAAPEANYTSSKEPTNARLNKLRMSTRVLGKMLSRLSVHQSSSRRPDNTDEAPLLPFTPPQILISPPSPGPEMQSPLREVPKEDLPAKDRLRPTVVGRNEHVPRKFRTRPSTWKPHRPPSPLPKSLRRHRKHKSEASASLHLTVLSPPPLPTRPKIASTVVVDPKPSFVSFSAPLDSTSDTSPTSPVWADIQMRLKARAMKSATYAVHDGGIISPTSS